jgi:hypothetical protein
MSPVPAHLLGKVREYLRNIPVAMLVKVWLEGMRVVYISYIHYTALETLQKVTRVLFNTDYL